jgi:amidohydrolase
MNIFGQSLTHRSVYHANMSNPTPQETLARAYALSPQLRAWRRALHQQPELGFHETKTAQRVAQALSQLGIEFRAGVGKTGLVAEIHSGQPGLLIALRADMDALPIHETNDCDYASQVPGNMHACGHDAHTAMLLGAAALFAQHPPTRGGVRFIFQPCEETQDEEGFSGAHRMLLEGAMTDVNAVLALHVTPMQPAGKVSYDAAISASVDNFACVLRGPGGHASMPHRSVDLGMVLGLLLNGLYTLVPRSVDPLHAATLTVGSVHGGDTHNVIPSEITLQGTLRTRSPQAYAAAKQAVEQVVLMARAAGASCEWTWALGALPVALNNNTLLQTMLRSAQDLLGQDCIGGDDELGLGGEDFSFFANAAPGAMLYLGTQLAGHGDWHTPNFDVDEAALPLGTAILVDSAIKLLSV